MDAGIELAVGRGAVDDGVAARLGRAVTVGELGNSMAPKCRSAGRTEWRGRHAVDPFRRPHCVRTRCVPVESFLAGLPVITW